MASGSRAIKLESPEFMVKYGIDIEGRRMIAGTSYLEQNTDNDVGFVMQTNFATALFILEHRYIPPSGKTRQDIPIVIELSSYGGDAYYGLAIFDRIQQVNAPVEIHGYGPLMSAGSLIFQSATKRILSPNAQLMIHFGWNEDAGVWDMERIKEANRHSEDLQRRIVAIYMSRWRGTEGELMQALNRESYFDAEKSVAMGLADKVMEIWTPGDDTEES